MNTEPKTCEIGGCYRAAVVAIEIASGPDAPTLERRRCCGAPLCERLARMSAAGFHVRRAQP